MGKWHTRRTIAHKFNGLILPHIKKRLKEESFNLEMDVTACSSHVVEVCVKGSSGLSVWSTYRTEHVHVENLKSQAFHVSMLLHSSVHCKNLWRNMLTHIIQLTLLELHVRILFQP
jgi:hypothetical protein